jgi:ABC-type cobalt transport system substrate-binding protein
MKQRSTLVWLGVAVAIPLLFWWFAPPGAEWAGTDDRMGELATPARQSLLEGPEWTPSTERALFLAQAATGSGLLGCSIWALRRRRRG